MEEVRVRFTLGALERSCKTVAYRDYIYSGGVLAGPGRRLSTEAQKAAEANLL